MKYKYLLVTKQRYSTWRPCIIIVYRRKNKCFQIFYCFIYLRIHPSLLLITNWFFVCLFLIQHPTPVLPTSSNNTYSPALESEPFLYVIGRRKMMDAENKCYRRMQQLPPFQGEGKKKDVYKHVFQTSLKVYFLPWVNMCWLVLI